jgi:uncharacterized protein YidB (DUF937 family)
MSFFRSLVNAVLAGFGDAGSPQAKLAQGVLDKLQSNDGGGLSAFAQLFHANGLGSIVQSWIGTGANEPITSQQLESAVGSDWIAQLAERAGVSSETVKTQLVEVLPKIVDRLTPSGKLPDVA